MQAEWPLNSVSPFRNALKYFQEGERAYSLGKGRSATPYSASSRERVAWQAGWENAEEELRYCTRGELVATISPDLPDTLLARKFGRARWQNVSQAARQTAARLLQVSSPHSGAL